MKNDVATVISSNLQHNKVETYDSYYYNGILDRITNSFEFFDIQSVQESSFKHIKDDSDKDLIIRHNYEILDSSLVHKRVVYSVMDILGDLDGIAEIILKVIGFILLPISEFSFNLQAIGDTYFARTKD